MKKLLLFSFLIVFAMGLIFGGCSKPGPAPAPAPAPATKPAPAPAPAPKTTVLNLATFVPKVSMTAQSALLLAERVTQRSNGELTIKYLGGPEIAPPFDLPASVKSGVIDIASFPSTFAKSFVPEIFSLPLTQIAPWEERKSGLYDYMVKVCGEKMGTYYLGRGEYGSPFHIFSNTRIAKPQDVKGLKLAITGGLGRPFLEALGAASAVVQPQDLYTAVERHTVDGCWLVMPGLSDWSMWEVIKYVVDQPINAPSVVLMMNLNKWNSLSKPMQNLVTQVMSDIEKEELDIATKAVEKNRQTCVSRSVEFIKFSPADAESYINTFYTAQWAEVKGIVSPEAYDTLRKLMSKQ